ncbi:MAG: restriction endonuclease subunit S [Ruminococcus sp.]|nr:restriction endonuclease subunit S [Ruminococcus sp.]
MDSKWQIKKMPEVVKWSSGGTPKATVKEYYENGDIPWLIIGDLNNGIITESETKITKLGLDNSSAKMIPPDTLLVAMYGSIGKLGITGIDCCTNQAIAYAKELYGVTTKYMFYYMAMIKPELISKGKGGTQKNISQTVLNSLDVIVPPLDEQQRIVSKIEELFSQLDSGVETLKKTKQQLKIYRQAVLKEAFEEIKEYTKLNELVVKIFDGPFGSNLKTADYVDSGVRVVRLENLKNGWFDDSKQSFVTSEKYDTIKKHTVYPSDLIMSTFIADNVKICQLPKYIGCAINKADCVGIRLKGEINAKYVLYYLMSKKVYDELSISVHGATRPRVNTTQIKNIFIPICIKSEQDKIVSEIEARLSVCDSIEKTIDKSLQEAEALRQSILKQAFEGVL